MHSIDSLIKVKNRLSSHYNGLSLLKRISYGWFVVLCIKDCDMQIKNLKESLNG